VAEDLELIGIISDTGGRRMNGFLVMAESYKKLMEQGKIEKEMRIYEFLATCDSDDLHRV
jgi:hypothetical protein